ncbi:MAG: ATPase, T2SS/T4P/T4SS family, partial [Myxococcota bacterium]
MSQTVRQKRTDTHQNPWHLDAQAAAGSLLNAPLETILTERNFTTPEQIAQAQIIAEEKGQSLEDVLLATQALTEEQLLMARSEQLDIPYITHIDHKQIPQELLEKIPFSFAKQEEILPLSLEDECLTVACTDPYNIEIFDQLQLLMQAEPIPLLCSKKALTQAINQTYDLISGNLGLEGANDDLDEPNKEEESEDIDIAITLFESSGDDEAPIIRLVNALIYKAIKEKASDIHIEPFEKEVKVRFRIDGVLQEVTNVSKRAQGHIAARIKIMSKLDIAEKRLPQDGRIRLKSAGKDVDLRVSVIPTSHGERVVMRLLDKSNVLLDLDRIGFPSTVRHQFNNLIHRSFGIILVTGPTGSGKTT